MIKRSALLLKSKEVNSTVYSVRSFSYRGINTLIRSGSAYRNEKAAEEDPLNISTIIGDVDKKKKKGNSKKGDSTQIDNPHLREKQLFQRLFADVDAYVKSQESVKNENQKSMELDLELLAPSFGSKGIVNSGQKKHDEFGEQDEVDELLKTLRADGQDTSLAQDDTILSDVNSIPGMRTIHNTKEKDEESMNKTERLPGGRIGHREVGQGSHSHTHQQPTNYEASSQDENKSLDILDNYLDRLLRTPTTKKIKTNHDKQKLIDAIFKRVNTALEPTIRYIMESEDLNTVNKTEAFFKQNILERWASMVEESKSNEELSKEIYFHRYVDNLVESAVYYDDVISSIGSASGSTPPIPKLNVLTMPIVFNAVLKRLSTRLFRGDLAYYLFNMLKGDIDLYTICCNQETYNEILKIQWVYFGKSNLYGVELTFVEMLNHGFQGDLVTYNIVKQIILDYYEMKMGKSVLYGNFPRWTQEDDRRVRNLEKNLVNLANSL